LRANFLDNPDLFLAQKVEVRVTARAGVDNGGYVFGKVVGIAEVGLMKSKRKPDRGCGCPNILPLFRSNNLVTAERLNRAPDCHTLKRISFSAFPLFVE